MSLAIFLILGTFAADGDFTELTGKIRVTGPAPRPTVSLKYDGGEVILSGELCSELQRAVTFNVTVVGRQTGSNFELREYEIADIGGGVKPVMGTLLKTGEGGFALRDGDGDAIPLSLRPSSKRRLSRMHGAKVWVYGKTLVSGEYKVRRYGVLRQPSAEQSEAEPSRDTKESASDD